MWLLNIAFLKPSHLVLTLRFWAHMLALPPLPPCCVVHSFFRWTGTVAAAALALCNDDQFVVTHSELHPRLQRTEPSKPGQGSPPPHTLSRHTLLLAVTVSVTHCWVCPPWDIGSISCSETIKFFSTTKCAQQGKASNKAQIWDRFVFLLFALHKGKLRTVPPSYPSALG